MKNPDQWAMLVEALSWRYGPEKAALIIKGKWPPAVADLDAWRRLGGRR